MTTQMKRQAFIDYDGRSPHTARITRNATRPNPVSVGVIVGQGSDTDTVLELEVRGNGQWSLVERPYGTHNATVRAEGQIGAQS